MKQTKPFYRILDEICEEKGIEEKTISFDWILELKKENKIRHVIGYQFGLNSAVSYNIAGDKYATYEVLKTNNIPTIEHRMLFNPNTRSNYVEENEIKNAKSLLKENDNKVVIKANDSCKGKDVHFCSNEEEIENVVKQLFEDANDTLSACPYVEIEYEYRTIFLEGKILYTYKKRKPYVTGDGSKTLRMLIDEKFDGNNIIEYSKNLDYDYVPKEKEDVIVSWKHNLSGGAEPILVDKKSDCNLEKIEEIAIRAAEAIDIKFASVDIALTSKNEILVMEINASVCMNKFAEVFPNGYEIAKGIYGCAIDKLFS